jgi:hypothetical protein
MLFAFPSESVFAFAGIHTTPHAPAIMPFCEDQLFERQGTLGGVAYSGFFRDA